jgi:[ribosomal protein S5]-alanine N-acetyltransferase
VSLVAIAPAFSELPTLSAGALTLRHINSADGASLQTVFGDTQVARFMGIPLLRTADDVDHLLAEIACGCRDKALFQWGLCSQDSPGLFGTCTLAHIDWANERAELGFALASSRWGKGIMRQVLPTLIDYAFSELALHRLEADVDPRNERSLRLLGHLSFEREGYLRERHLVAGERQDTILLGLLAPSWRRLRRDA